MELTHSYREAVPSDVLARYEVREVRNAARVLSSVYDAGFTEIMTVLGDFALGAEHLLLPGGNEGLVAQQLNLSMRKLGWREARVDTEVVHTLVTFPFTAGGESSTKHEPMEPQRWKGYKADWVRGRVAGDCEWNAKDGNLDRDFASYRSLYEAGFIDGAVLITRTQDDLRLLEGELVEQLLSVGAERAAEITGFPAKGFQASIDRIVGLRAKGQSSQESRLGTSTTTNLTKLIERLTRGDGGGCPILVVAICDRTWNGVRLDQ